MSTRRRSRIVTSHSDELAELGEDGQGGEAGSALAAYSTEESPIAELYKKERDMQRTFGYRARANEQVVDEDVYIPPDEEPP
jgi:hypothetical protein